MAIIMHIDMDAFFASIEERDSQYKDKPLIVGVMLSKNLRGIVSTANYKARKFGVKSGMSLKKAFELLKNVDFVFVQPNFDVYERESEIIMKILKENSDAFEQASIDEAFIDVSKRCKNMQEAKALALLLKAKIYEKTGLTCSIGIGSNKLIAKIASGMKKPDGLTTVKLGEEKEFLSELKLSAIPGIGKKTEQLLKKQGITKISDLQKKSVFWLLKNFGKMGIYYFYAVNGIDKSKVEEEEDFKSIGKEKTFADDVLDEMQIYSCLDELCRIVWNELKQKKLYFKTIELKVRYANFETHTCGKSFLKPIDNNNEFKQEARKMLQQFLGSPMRLIGVRAKNFVKEKQFTLDINNIKTKAKSIITKN